MRQQVHSYLRRLIGAALLLVCVFGSAPWSEAQSPQPMPASGNATETGGQSDTRWEVSLDGQVGAPSGFLQVGENKGINVPGTRLELRSDLGIDISGGVEGSVAYHLTPDDALRGTFLYLFLDGTNTVSHPITYNGLLIPPGPVHTTADVAQFSLAYERRLLPIGSRGSLTGSFGLTYVYFDPSVNGNDEDFYAQELPVPIVGFRLDYPLGERLGLTASLSGGGLPRVNSLRTEGGTVYLQQSQADALLGLTYAVSPTLHIEAGYRFTYFWQHETSHEDNNEVELLNNGVQVGLRYRF